MWKNAYTTSVVISSSPHSDSLKELYPPSKAFVAHSAIIHSAAEVLAGILCSRCLHVESVGVHVHTRSASSVLPVRDKRMHVQLMWQFPIVLSPIRWQGNYAPSDLNFRSTFSHDTCMCAHSAAKVLAVILCSHCLHGEERRCPWTHIQRLQRTAGAG